MTFLRKGSRLPAPKPRAPLEGQRPLDDEPRLESLRVYRLGTGVAGGKARARQVAMERGEIFRRRRPSDLSELE